MALTANRIEIEALLIQKEMLDCLRELAIVQTLSNRPPRPSMRRPLPSRANVVAQPASGRHRRASRAIAGVGGSGARRLAPLLPTPHLFFILPRRRSPRTLSSIRTHAPQRGWPVDVRYKPVLMLPTPTAASAAGQDADRSHQRRGMRGDFHRQHQPLDLTFQLTIRVVRGTTDPQLVQQN